MTDDQSIQQPEKEDDSTAQQPRGRNCIYSNWQWWKLSEMHGVHILVGRIGWRIHEGSGISTRP